MINSGINISLLIEFSVPKLIFGNNFEEVTDEHFDIIVQVLHDALVSMAVEVELEVLMNARVVRVHYSKNLIITEHSTCREILQVFAKSDISKRLDVSRTTYKNDGDIIRYHTSSYELTFYDKLKDLQTAIKLSERRAFERQGRMQSEFLQRAVGEEVLRMEFRINDMNKLKNDVFPKMEIEYPEPTFRNLFKRELSRRLTLLFVKENQVLDKKSNSAQLMAYQMFVMMAASYANSINDNVKRGFGEKRRNGESPGHVPIGYLTKDGEVTLDPFKSIFVRELFEEYAMGLISIPTLAEKYGKRGLTTSRGNKPISKSQVDRMISHPFYYGFIEDFDERPHKYERLITKELFDRCQDVKYKRGYHKYKRTYQDFIFNGLIVCSKCDIAYSSYIKKGRLPTPDKEKDIMWTYNKYIGSEVVATGCESDKIN